LFTKVERLISSRNLKPKKKEGFLKIISIFSFVGIMLGVAILIIVMSVMNGFKTDLTNKILGLNPHIVVQPNSFIIDNEYILKIKENLKDASISKTYSGEGIIIINDKAKGIIFKGVNIHEKKIKEFFENNIVSGSINQFKKNNIFIGTELAFNLDLKEGDNINLMSSAFVATPLGSLPKQETFKIAGIFNTGFVEIYLKNPLEANTYKKKIEKLNQNYFIYTWADLNKSFFSALKVERNVMFIILTLIIIVAAFNIISGLTILIKNKTKEIAILKTLGLSNKSIKRSFFLTGFTIGFFASISGIIL
jgi:lipoprotein-releasing system permease protein